MFKDPYLTEDDLAFIAEDIGPQLLKHFKPETVIKKSTQRKGYPLRVRRNKRQREKVGHPDVAY